VFYKIFHKTIGTLIILSSIQDNGILLAEKNNVRKLKALFEDFNILYVLVKIFAKKHLAVCFLLLPCPVGLYFPF